MTASLEFIGYALAGTVFLLLAVLLLTAFRGRAQGKLLAVASLVSAVWGFGHAYLTILPAPTSFPVFLLEFFQDLAWLVFLGALLSGAVGSAQFWIVRLGGILVALGLLIFGASLEYLAASADGGAGAGGLIVFGSILTSLFGLVAIEQIYRNARDAQRNSLKYLCLGLGGLFAYDLFVYSNAVLVAQVNDVVWAARGFVAAICVPLIAVAARRAPNWSVGIFVSRQIVLYTATLLAAGIYLTAVGFIGYYIRVVGANWGSTVQVIFSFAAFLVLGIFLVSERMRARLRVFISKHFFENKYDYREEWLRLIETLTLPDDAMPLRKRAIKALAQIVDSPSGLLWLRESDSSDYRCRASWNTQSLVLDVKAHSSLPRFLERSGWIIERREFESNSSRYSDLDLADFTVGAERSEFVIPLLHDAGLLGFVALAGPATADTLNFEDRDLLKTAGKQIASYLAQEISTEQLAESKQFEAYNRLTAYIMHDMKNLIAQQSLVVENAQKHRDKPEFIDDAIETIKGSVARMRRVIEHLQQGSVENPTEKVELGKLVMQAVSQCADRPPYPRAIIGDDQVWVRADKERLMMAIFHGIRNAQEATPVDGQVTVELSINGRECDLTIADTGKGMDEEFIRERLFRPFDSTKGTSGMGIGAYQIRETIKMAGGTVRVRSAPKQGTSLTMRLEIER